MKHIKDFNKMKNFIYSAFNTLSTASHGKYSARTGDVQKLRTEMLYSDFGSFRTDKENLNRDKKAVSGDVKKAFYQIIINTAQ